MISILIPTRGRREGLLRTISSAREMANKPQDLEFVVYLDEDDAHTYDGIDGIVRVVGRRIVLSNMWNKCAKAAHGDIFQQGNDDVVYRTLHWDLMVTDAFEKCPDGILLVHGNDGSGDSYASGRGDFGPHPFVSRRWVEVVGYLTPACYSSDFGDTHLNEVANALGRRRYLPFIVEHMHHIFGKAALDETTNDRLQRHSADNVAQLYGDLSFMRLVDVEKLMAEMR